MLGTQTPVVLGPIVTVEALLLEQGIGDITGELSSTRGLIQRAREVVRSMGQRKLMED